MTRRRFAVVVSLVVVVLLVVLGLLTTEAPFGGVSRAEAIAAAEGQVESTTPQSVAWAVVAPLVFFRDGASDAVAPWNEMVWAVRLNGTYPFPSCGPIPPPGQQPHCPPDAHTATVVLDYRTGRFVMASMP